MLAQTQGTQIQQQQQHQRLSEQAAVVSKEQNQRQQQTQSKKQQNEQQAEPVKHAEDEDQDCPQNRKVRSHPIFLFYVAHICAILNPPPVLMRISCVGSLVIASGGHISAQLVAQTPRQRSYHHGATSSASSPAFPTQR
jgi:ATP-dependent 26S proteasome regulatory subunit